MALRITSFPECCGAFILSMFFTDKHGDVFGYTYEHLQRDLDKYLDGSGRLGVTFAILNTGQNKVFDELLKSKGFVMAGDCYNRNNFPSVLYTYIRIANPVPVKEAQVEAAPRVSPRSKNRTF